MGPRLQQLYENVSRYVIERLRAAGNTVTRFIELGPRGSLDPFVLAVATQGNALLITNDKDFGELIYRQRLAHSGVLLVRLSKLTLEEEAEAVAQLIEEHGEALLDAFTVIKQRGKPRIRKSFS
jgi:predicted nuclease of predicted toxin-antitoxin system